MILSSSNIQDYSNIAAELEDGMLPAVSFIVPRPKHDMHPGYNEPVATGINFLDDLIQQVQGSSIWTTTAIIITFDDGGGWYDQVPPPQVESGPLPRTRAMLTSQRYPRPLASALSQNETTTRQ